MNVADDYSMGANLPAATPALVPGAYATASNGSKPAPPKARHRVADVRRRQGVSIRSASRRMGIPMEQVRKEEKPDANLTLEDLARWQRALDVPLTDLLVDNDAPVANPVIARAKWLKLMKTVKALLESSPNDSITRMARMLESQVLEVMPELEDVGAWHSVGQRRTQDEMGRIAEQPIPGSFARDGLQ